MVPEPLGGTVSWASLGLSWLLPAGSSVLGRVPGHYLALKRHAVKVCLMRKGRHLSFKVLGGPLACVSTSLGRLEWPAWRGGGGEERGRTDSMSLQ